MGITVIPVAFLVKLFPARWFKFLLMDEDKIGDGAKMSSKVISLPSFSDEEKKSERLDASFEGAREDAVINGQDDKKNA